MSRLLHNNVGAETEDICKLEIILYSEKSILEIILYLANKNLFREIIQMLKNCHCVYTIIVFTYVIIKIYQLI